MALDTMRNNSISPDEMALRAIQKAISLLKDANNAAEKYGEYLKITKAFRFDPNGFPDTDEITDLIQEAITRSQKQMDMLHCIGYFADSKDNDGKAD